MSKLAFVLHLIILHRGSCGKYEMVPVSCDDTWMYKRTDAMSLLHCTTVCDLNNRCLGLSFVEQSSECKLYEMSPTQCTEQPQDAISVYRRIREGKKCSFTSYESFFISKECGVSFVRTPLVLQVQACKKFAVSLYASDMGDLEKEYYRLHVTKHVAFSRLYKGSVYSEKSFKNDFGYGCPEYKLLWIDLTTNGTNANFTVGTGSDVDSNLVSYRVDEWSYHSLSEVKVRAWGGAKQGNWTFFEQI